MDLASLTKADAKRAENPDDAANIAAAARAKEAREDRAHHYAIVSANATDRTVTFKRSYRVGGESRTVRERVAPASRLTAGELLAHCREAVRLGAHRLERKGMRISDEDRLDAAAELCTRTLEGTNGALPNRESERLGKTYMRERASGIVLDVFRKRQREELTDDFDLTQLTERAESRAADNAPDPYLEGATGDPAADYLRRAARTLDPWPHSPIEAAVCHATMPAVPSDQWAEYEQVKPSTWRTRCQQGRKQLAKLDPADVRAAIREAEDDEKIVTEIDAIEGTIITADDIERERAEFERMIGERP
jgi:hypothetical protein